MEVHCELQSSGCSNSCVDSSSHEYYNIPHEQGHCVTAKQ